MAGYLFTTRLPAPSDRLVLDPPTCGSCHVGHLVERSGVYGKFFGCSRFPLCAATYTSYEANEMYDCHDWAKYGEQPF